MTTQSERFTDECKQLSGSIANRADGLKGFEEQIQDVISEISSSIDTVGESVQEVAAELRSVAADIEENLTL